MENLKYQMFQQEFTVTSPREPEVLGTMRMDIKGNRYVYAKAGDTALAAGKMTVAPAIPAAVLNRTGSAHKLGSETLALTIGSATFGENYFKGGWIDINDGDGEGHRYNIVGSSAVTAGTAIYLTLSEGLREAMTTGSEFTLVPSPFQGAVISATEESRPTGIPIVDVPASYCYWSQVSGDAVCLISGTPAVGTMLTLASTAGAVGAINSSLDIDQPIIGQMWGTVGVSGEYKPIVLNLM